MKIVGCYAYIYINQLSLFTGCSSCYRDLMKTEGVEIESTKDGISRIAESAFRVNEKTENIGARRLHTVLERLMDGISFDASERRGEKIIIDESYVSEVLNDVVENEDLSRFIL